MVSILTAAMVMSEPPDAVLARLDERTGYIAKEVGELASGQRAAWAELNEVKSSVFKARAEIAETKGSMIALEERERERNGNITRLVNEGQKQATDIGALRSQFLDLEGDYKSRMTDAEANIGVLMGLRHDETLKDETIDEHDLRQRKARSEFRERWHFGFEIIGALSVAMGAAYGLYQFVIGL